MSCPTSCLLDQEEPGPVLDQNLQGVEHWLFPVSHEQLNMASFLAMEPRPLPTGPHIGWGRLP